jgi:hypothetical protein
MKKKTVYLCTLFLVATVSKSFATGVCDIALSNNAINTSDASITSKIAFQKKEDLCRSEFSSAEEFRNSARNSGFNVGYAGFTLGHSGGKRTGSGKLSFNSEEFCQANQVDLNTFYTSRIKTSVADIALEAWRDCIKVTQENAFFIEYSESSDSNGATGFLHRRIIDGTTHFSITDMKVQPSTVEVKCYVNGEAIQKGKLNVVMDSARESFSCDKPEDENVRVGFGTNIGDPIFIEMHSKEYQKQTTMDELASRVNVVDSSLARIDKVLTSHDQMFGRKIELSSIRFTVKATNCDRLWGGNREAKCKIPLNQPGQVLGAWVQIYGSAGHTSTNIHVSEVSNNLAFLTVDKYRGDLDPGWKLDGELRIAFVP